MIAFVRRCSGRTDSLGTPRRSLRSGQPPSTRSGGGPYCAPDGWWSFAPPPQARGRGRRWRVRRERADGAREISIVVRGDQRVQRPHSHSQVWPVHKLDPGRGRPTNFAVRCARQRLAATPYPLFLQRTLVSRKRAKIGARAGPIWHYAALRGTTWHKSAPYMYAYMRVRRTSGIATSCHPAQLPRGDRARPPGRRATVDARGR